MNSTLTEHCNAYLGLGSNMGDRVQNIIDARKCLHGLSFVRALQSSSLYLSSPVGYSDQADFINCVVSMRIECEPETLFAEMQEIEQSLGRVRDASNQNAPRIIDLDLLVVDDVCQDDPALTIPHPRISERLFVLMPLSELTPDLNIPGHGVVADILEQGFQHGSFIDQKLYKLGA